MPVPRVFYEYCEEIACQPGRGYDDDKNDYEVTHDTPKNGGNN